ncbi:MAG: hypothetical protein C7B43_05830 [Sulfobacillus benefaciens]|uniref:Uncharacterized protein n=1 Tax=Sulfobacillus benefaciens TaxID=453960 RepID=A0A2T2X814_9FIRM|nr:MAG: hypothetical protein C7B43_05830 [Sulfobacillus benefaciens]
MLTDSLSNLSYTDPSQVVDLSTTGGPNSGVNRQFVPTGTLSKPNPTANSGGKIIQGEIDECIIVF